MKNCDKCGQEIKEDNPFDGIFISLDSAGNGTRTARIVVDVEHLLKCGIKSFATNGRMLSVYNRKFTKEEATEMIRSMDYQCDITDRWKSSL